MHDEAQSTNETKTVKCLDLTAKLYARIDIRLYSSLHFIECYYFYYSCLWSNRTTSGKENQEETLRHSLVFES